MNGASLPKRTSPFFGPGRSASRVREHRVKSPGSSRDGMGGHRKPSSPGAVDSIAGAVTDTSIAVAQPPLSVSRGLNAGEKGCGSEHRREVLKRKCDLERPAGTSYTTASKRRPRQTSSALANGRAKFRIRIGSVWPLEQEGGYWIAGGGQTTRYNAMFRRARRGRPARRADRAAALDHQT